MKRWRRWAITIAVVVAGVLLLRLTIFRPPSIEAEIARVDRGPVEDVVSNSQAGTVRSRWRVQLSAERAGQVASIPRREGSDVKRGEVLLRLDDSTQQMQDELARRTLEAAEARLRAARAEAVLARQDHERTSKLYATGNVAKETLDQATSRLDAAEAGQAAAAAEAAQARSSLDLANDELTHMRVVAPFDGVVTQRFVEVGEAVVPGQPVLEVMSPDSLYISAPIDEMDIGRLHVGLPARVTLDPYPGKVWHGVVSRVAPYVDATKEQSRTLEVEVEVKDNGDMPRPRPGTSADVEIIVSRSDSTLRIPTMAVLRGDHVYAVEHGRVRDVTFEPGLHNWNWTEVQSGLEPGTPVITNLDQPGLHEGVRVSIRPQKPEAAAATRP